MAVGQWAVVVRSVQRLFHGGSVAGLTEGQLLDRFVSDRDEAAFGAIVARHGPMVLGVCRGVLRDPHDVDDAFQATFLILVKKAASLRDRDQLSPWLYGVARRVALRARSEVARRKSRETAEVEPVDPPVATLDAELRELQTLIREEVDRLSSQDRMAVVLCYLEGLTHEEAADRLGWPVGTVKGRLSRAREKLRSRLTRRGVALPAAAITTALGRATSAAVPLELLRATTLAATRVASGLPLSAGIVSAPALSLMNGVLGTMFTTKLKIAATALVASTAFAVPGVMAYQGLGPAVGEGQAPTKADKPAAPADKTGPGEFGPGPGRGVSGLPGGGGGMSGPAAPSTSPIETAAAEGWKFHQKMFEGGESSATLAVLWSKRLAEAQAGFGSPEEVRKSALQSHVSRMKILLQQTTELVKNGQSLNQEALEARYALSEAEQWLADGRIGGKVEEGTPFGGGGGGGFGGASPRRRLVVKTMPSDEKRNQAILAKLEEVISMNFPSPTPLEDVEKYLQQCTQDEKAGLPAGIPIYIDPVSLEGTGHTMASTVQINLEGIPLRTTLQLLLRQLDLHYRVEGGLLLITSDPEEIPAPPGGPGMMGGGRMTGGAGGSGFR